MTPALSALAALSTTLALAALAPALGLTLLRARKTHRTLAVVVVIAACAAGAAAFAASPRSIPALFAIANAALVVDVGVTARRCAAAAAGRFSLAGVVTGGVAGAVALAALVVTAWSASKGGDASYAALAFAVVSAVRLALFAFVALKAEPRLAKLRGATFDAFAHVGLAVVAGVVLLVDVPALAAHALELDVPTALAVAVLAGTCAAAVVDVAAWRDASVRRALTDASIARAPTGREKVSNTKAIAWSVPSLVLALGLPLFAVEDVIAAQEAPSSQASLLAQLIAPRDARLEVKEARASIASGDVSGARARLGAIALAHAWAPAADRLRLDLCLDAGDVACLASLPARVLHDDDDAHALAARGLLARDAGDRGQAAQLLDKAIEAASTKVGADGVVDDAALAPAAIALAELQAREKRWAASAALLERVVEGAEAHNRPDTALLAHADRGRVLDAGGNPKAALAAYQRALQIAGVVNEPREEAELWLDYAGLLSRSQAPAKSVAACLLSAQREAPKGSDVEKKAGAALQAIDPAVVDAVRPNLDDEAARTTAFVYDNADAPPGFPVAAPVDDDGAARETPPR